VLRKIVGLWLETKESAQIAVSPVVSLFRGDGERSLLRNAGPLLWIDVVGSPRRFGCFHVWSL
jgi:hypothetical protein